MSNAFVSHVEWCCQDIEQTATFFQALFGWEFKAFGNNYLLYSPARGPAVGLLRSERMIAGENCLVFVTVDNIESHLQHATAIGGKVHVKKTAIPKYGWYAQVKDPEGNIVGLFETF